jgi:hypothetical protein
MKSSSLTGKLGCTGLMACIDPVLGYQKHAREALSDALRARISRAYERGSTKQWPYMGYRSKLTVGVGLWGVGGGYGKSDESSNHMRSVKTVAIPPVWLPAFTQQSQVCIVSEPCQKLRLIQS